MVAMFFYALVSLFFFSLQVQPGKTLDFYLNFQFPRPRDKIACGVKGGWMGGQFLCLREVYELDLSLILDSSEMFVVVGGGGG